MGGGHRQRSLVVSERGAEILPNTNGSQFFIVYKDSTAGLGPHFTPFGTVSSGLNIVREVARSGYSCQYIEGGGAPREKIVINSVKITTV
jgi:peptidyl-prolyl cis-trans isomerase B (cyclophilin B)